MSFALGVKPWMAKPATKTDLPLPTFLSRKAPVAVPVSVTTSLPNGVVTGAPVKVASVAALYTLLAAESPDKAKVAGVMLAARLVG